MKTQALLFATAAIIALPVAAHAGTTMDQDVTYSEDIKADVVVSVQTEDDINMFTDGTAEYVFKIPSGEQLVVKGESAFIIDANGNKFYAPESAYYTDSGYTVNVEDGAVYSIVEPADFVAVDVDLIKEDPEINTYVVR